MPSLLRKFQNHGRRDIFRYRQCGRRHERIIERIDDKRGHFYVLEPGLAARSIPIVFGISEAVQWGGHKVVEFIQRPACGHRMRR